MRRVPNALLLIALTTLTLAPCWAGTIPPVDLTKVGKPLYQPEGDAFVRHNGGRYNNRPLYCNQINAVVLAGDQPLVRVGEGIMNGTFMLAIARGNQAKWLQDCADITSKYRPGRMEWIVKDPALGATVVTLEAVTPAEGAGIALRCKLTGARSGDRLIWAFGGANSKEKAIQWSWDVTVIAHNRAEKMTWGFRPQDSEGNQVKIQGDRFQVSSPEGRSMGVSMGRCGAPSTLRIADAGSWHNPLEFAASSGDKQPILCGVTPLEGQQEICWAVQSFNGSKAGDTAKLKHVTEFVQAGMKRAEETGRRVVVQTPDPQLDAAVSASLAAVDGLFRRGNFTHGGMNWGVALLGWRSMFGGTVYGWHDRVLTQARFCLAKQITESKKTKPESDPAVGLTGESLNSRFYGKGRVGDVDKGRTDAYHGYHYDMQSQFFDQLIHAWRWTGDPELEKILRPALELHCEYIDDCFDPDGDGLYESYLNTWATDGTWYNGAGTPEETGYAFTAHKAALEMARRVGDSASVERHEAQVAKIQKNFLEKLWIPERGHPGFIEQGGHQRVHGDVWLPSIYLAIDAGLLPREKAASSLYYTEWGLEREQMPYGGQRCWPSNWVPSIWSVREMWPGDNYHLALNYQQIGLADEGWDLLRGTFPLYMFHGTVPGDTGAPAGGTDFHDSAHPFCREVVEGLFGYRPDYPNGLVTFAPQFPSSWDHAKITTPDVAIAFKNNRYQIDLSQSAALDVRLPIRAKKVAGVSVNGQPAQFELLPGYGRSEVRLQVPKTQSATIEVSLQEPLPQFAPVQMEVNLGEKVELPIKDAQLLEAGNIPATPGYHLVEALVQTGETQQRRLFKIKVNDPQGEAARAAKIALNAPAQANWKPVDMSGFLNGDIRGIFEQKYLSPRPQTCSRRLATDGYTIWQAMLHSGVKSPTVSLDKIQNLLDQEKRIVTPQGARFAWPGESRNIAFTSLWDNWPRSVSVPVKGQAEQIWFLVCGTTNPMQGRIANAELRMKYADGVVEKLELVPPLNFWSLCHFSKVDYNMKRDAFALPKVPPSQVQLGKGCRAMVYGWNLRPGVALQEVSLETLSQEVVIGLMGVSLCNPH